MRDASFYSSSNSHVGGSIEIPEWGGIGTEESPARTCADLARLPHSVSGHYFLRPSEDFPAFKGYCDLESFGGGWLMCYTTSGEVHVSREVSSTVPFPNEGYRSDCRDYPFNQVMYVEHDIRTGATSEDKAYFNFRGRNALVASRSGYRGSVNQSWAVGLGADGILFDAKGFASTRTPECVQERANSGCRAPLVSALNKLQECPDCYAVRPQLGNATCLPAAGTDASLCWCDSALPQEVQRVKAAAGTLQTAGCSSDTDPKHTLYLSAAHEAVTNFYAGWQITITSGTGTGQSRKVFASSGGTCSSASYSTRATCLASRATWTPEMNSVRAETAFDPLPCSNSMLDGFRCRAACSPTYPLDGTSCNNEVVYATAAGCQTSCLSFDAYERTYSIDYQGFDGGSTLLAAAVGNATTEQVEVTDAAAAAIAIGKSIKIDTEIMLVTLVDGNRLVVVRGANFTTAAAHSLGAAVATLVNFAREPLPSCPYVCSTTYRLDGPHECTELDWACGYGEVDGVRRGYTPAPAITGTPCTGTCSCDNAGVATCSVTGEACVCRASTDPHGTALASPWHPSIVRMAGGLNTDACSGPFERCVGSNPYSGYKLTIGGQQRRIIGYSGFYKVVQLDSPLPSAPIPAPSSDSVWSGAAGYSMQLAPGCSQPYDNDLEKRECTKTQLYELMVCDNARSEGFRGRTTSGGFIMTGYNASTACRKTCEDATFCEDYTTDWYRADTGHARASGVAFKRNGNRAIGIRAQLLSVGVRLVDNEHRLS